MTLADLQAFADSLNAAQLMPATQRRTLAAVKSLFGFGHRLGYFAFDVARPLRLPPMRDTLAERILDESSVLRMVAWEPSPRNVAIIAVFFGAALRVSELVGLRWRDVHARNDGQGQVTVFGKRGKTRTILVSAGVFSRITGLRNGASDDDPVFRSRKKGGRLHPSQVLRITKAAAKRAGITRNVRNHDLRHSAASAALEHHAPISVVQQTLGHSSLQATTRYCHARPGDSIGRYLPI